jgi:hypothetical protein
MLTKVGVRYRSGSQNGIRGGDETAAPGSPTDAIR